MCDAAACVALDRWKEEDFRLVVGQEDSRMRTAPTSGSFNVNKRRCCCAHVEVFGGRTQVFSVRVCVQRNIVKITQVFWWKFGA